MPYLHRETEELNSGLLVGMNTTEMFLGQHNFFQEYGFPFLAIKTQQC